VHPLRLAIGVAIVLVTAATVVTGVAINTDASAPDSMIVLTGSWAIVGAIVIVLRPRHPIGWLFALVGLLWTAGLTATTGAERLDPGALLTFCSWWSEWFWIAAFALMIGSFFVIPTGRVPSPAWRPVLSVFAVSVGAIIVAAALEDELQAGDTAPIVDNPIGIGGLGDVENVLGGAPLALLLFAGAAAAAWSQFARYRRADAVERQQLKLVALATPIAVVGALLGGLTNGTAVEPVARGVAVLAMPVAVAIAILRYRLFDVDVAIRRTIVYGALSLLLVAAYGALVLAGQAVFASFAGGGDLAIAVSTLVVAALFLPLRARVQGFVDRRFYRRRYDAQRTLEAFGARLREQVELDALRSDLAGVVRETIEPAHVSVWLYASPDPRRRRLDGAGHGGGAGSAGAGAENSVTIP
jgi:hypothetical protein